MTEAALPDLVVGLVRVHSAAERPFEERAGILAHVAELVATVQNRGDALANETTTRFWLCGPDIDRELRVVYTPPIPAGDEIEVTALWDIRRRGGRYLLTVSADAFTQIDEARKDNNAASIRVTVEDNCVKLD
jgi:hypothetical protein